jgi:hypothetical protein
MDKFVTTTSEQALAVMTLLEQVRLKKKKLEEGEDQLVLQLSSIITNLPHSQYSDLPVSASFITSLFQQVDLPIIKKRKFEEKENDNNNNPPQKKAKIEK